MTTIIENAAQSRETRHVPGVCFKCADCLRVLPVQTEGVGTGYATDPKTGILICYECVAKRDAEEMQSTGRAVLYLSENKDRQRWPSAPYKVGNWPGTLEFPVYGVRKSFHNFTGRDGRTDFWFKAFGREWHGVNIGDSQIARCKALKGGE